MSFKKIMIAVNDSECALEAAKKGIELAHQLSAQLMLVYVIETARTVVNVDAGITPEDALMLMKNEAERIMREVQELYNGERELLKFTPEGSPRDEIIKMAAELQADLIVIGTHGRTGLQHLLMGSTAEYVVRHSSIPVMVVRAE